MNKFTTLMVKAAVGQAHIELITFSRLVEACNKVREGTPLDVYVEFVCDSFEIKRNRLRALEALFTSLVPESAEAGQELYELFH